MANNSKNNQNKVSPEYLLLGEILRPHGIRGELRVKLFTDYPERINQLGYVFLGKSPESKKVTRHDVEHMRMHQNYGLLKLKSIDDRNDAEVMRELFVMVHIEDAVPLDDDEIYLYQLIGIEVRTDSGDVIGVITEVLETGANDVYVIESPQYGEVLFPVLDETIVESDIDNGTITVRIPEGLLPEN
ncbi:MAG: ribosome maturation factor RimM [Aggregatilineales bacterium]